MAKGPLDPRLLRHARAARGAILRAAVIGIAQAATTIVQALALAVVVTRVAGGQGLDAVRVPLSVLFAVVLLRAALAWLGEYCAVSSAAAVQEQLRAAVFRAALDRGPVWLASRGAADLTTLLTTGVRAMEQWFGRYLPALVLAVVLPPAVVVMVMALHDVRSAVTVLVTLPLVPLFAVLIGWATQRRAAQQWSAMRRLSGHFLDALAGLRTLRTYGRAQRQTAVVAEVAEQHHRATMPVLRVAFLSSAALELVGTISVALVAVSTGLRLVSGSVGLQTALVVLLLAPEAYRPLREVGARFHASADAATVLSEVDEVLRREPRAPVTRWTGTGAPALRARGVVVREGGQVLVQQADVDVAPGALTVLVGPTASGKSTLLDVLLGLRAPQAGEILVGGSGHWVPAGAPDALGPGAVAVLPQRPGFPGARTVAQALLQGWPEAAEATLRTALAAVGLADELRLDQPLGEEAGGLSAGQRQRLAVARTLLAVRAGARLVVADEPTAHLDAASEQTVIAALRALTRERAVTVLAVAHRPALVAAADSVQLLDAPAPAPAPAPALAPAGEPGAAPQRPVEAAAVRLDRPARPLPGLGLLLGVLAAVSSLALTATASWLILRAAEHPPVLALSIAVVGTRLFGIARPVLRYLERLVNHSTALRTVARLRAQVYSSLVPRIPGAAVVRSGDAVTGVVADVDAVLDRTLRGTRPMVVAGLVGVLAVSATAVVLPAAAVVLASGLLLAGVVAPALTGLATAGAEHASAGAAARLAEEVLEPLRHGRDLIDGPARDGAVGRVRSAAGDVRSAQLRHARGLGFGAGLAAAAFAAVPAAMTVVAAPAVAAGQLSGLMFAVLVLAPVVMAELLGELPAAVTVLLRSAQARRRLRGFAASEPPATEPIHPTQPPSPPFAVTVSGLHAGWAEADTLRGLDLTLPPGARVAVLGASGSGKSTLAAVLLRLLDPKVGTVHLGPVDIAELPGDTARRLVGWVSDDDHVFAASLRANLLLARPGATDDQLRTVLARAGLQQWATRLDVELGEGAVPLSGGERRRLALARALLLDPPVLVLDEPTEGLDPPTARRVLTDLLEAAEHRTVLLLTHREEGLELMDRVLELRQGRLHECRLPENTAAPQPDPVPFELTPPEHRSVIAVR